MKKLFVVTLFLTSTVLNPGPNQSHDAKVQEVANNIFRLSQQKSDLDQRAYLAFIFEKAEDKSVNTRELLYSLDLTEPDGRYTKIGQEACHVFLGKKAKNTKKYSSHTACFPFCR